MPLSKLTMATVTMKLTVAAPAGTGLTCVSFTFNQPRMQRRLRQTTELLATNRIREVGNVIPTGKLEKFNG